MTTVGISGHSLVVEPDDGRAAILNAIGSARSSLDMTIYELSDPAVVAALIAAQDRKVQVRILYNWYSFDPGDQQSDVSPTLQKLTAAGVTCKPAPREFEVTHEKAFVVDGQSAFVMSLNLVAEYFGSTRDFGVLTTVRSEVNEIAAVFEADWNGQPITPGVQSLVWSPVSSRTKLTSVIQGAAKTLDVYFEEIGDPGTLAALVAAAKRGVRVRVISAVLQTSGPINGNARGITYLNEGGVDAVSMAYPVNVPGQKGPVQLYFHAKSIVADYGMSGAVAFVGSENLSCTSLDDNRECGILVDDPAILARIETTFNNDWAHPPVLVTPDSTPLSPCPGHPSIRASGRLAARDSATRAVHG
jgi:cardiolipin synthase A/B